MAPLPPRRPSQPATKPVHRKRPTRQQPTDSWELLDTAPRDSASHSPTADAPDAPTPSVASALRPLREMADRVGQEVESFAETLDRFFDARGDEAAAAGAGANNFDDAHGLVVEFQELAEEKVGELRREHEREWGVVMRGEWRARQAGGSGSGSLVGNGDGEELSARKRGQVDELRRWQQEAGVWDLFRVMLELKPFDADRAALQQEGAERMAKLGTPHRYTPEGELWERFLLHDDLARERYLVKQWLERAAANQESGVEGIVEELEEKAGRGKGLWSSGWLHSREKIKGEKRLRSWPVEGEGPLPELRSREDGALVVTTLDPDAPARQQRGLEKEDAFFEKAMWIACWEMLRRGKEWHDVCEWCEERREGWRAVCLGKELDFASTSTSSAWKYACRTAAQSGTMGDYEAAVFGLMGGDIRSMEKVCRTMDDYLYAHYSAALTQQFDQYLLEVCPERATPQPWRRGYVDDAVQDKDSAEQSITDLINRLKSGPKTRDEYSQPLKIIQGYLLADQVGSLIHTLGVAISNAPALLEGSRKESLFVGTGQAPAVDVRNELELALDPQALRIAAHMSLVFRVMSPHHLQGEELAEDENVLVAYIQALRAAGMRLLTPVYASRLQRERAIVTLGRVLVDITDIREQVNMLRLMQQYQLDVVSILTEQLKWVQERNVAAPMLERPLRILEPTEDTTLYPGVQIQLGFLDYEPSTEDEAVIRALQWYSLLHGKWSICFEAFTNVLRSCLVQGRIALALQITQAFPPSTIAKQKTNEIYGQPIDPLDPSTHPSEESAATGALPLLVRQCRPYHELCLLVSAVDSLAIWRAEEHRYIGGRAKRPTAVPASLKRAKAQAAAAMEPLLTRPGILIHGMLGADEAAADVAARELAHVRIAIVPEVVLAYAALLHVAGNCITRDALLEAMELGVAVAGGGEEAEGVEASSIMERAEVNAGNGLEQAFRFSGRSRELVRQLAVTSKAMLVLKAEGKPWKARGREGRELGLWEVSRGMPVDEKRREREEAEE